MIIDDFLSQEDWDYCYNYFKGDYWKFPNLDNIQGNQGWRIFVPEVERNIGLKLFNQLTTYNIGPYSLKRVGINGATMYNDSHLHRDGKPGDLSVVWFASKEWEDDWQGGLEINGEVIRYVPNRVVLFDSYLEHIPHSPSIRNKLRISVGLHLEPSSSWSFNYKERDGYI